MRPFNRKLYAKITTKYFDSKMRELINYGMPNPGLEGGVRVVYPGKGRLIGYVVELFGIEDGTFYGSTSQAICHVWRDEPDLQIEIYVFLLRLWCNPDTCPPKNYTPVYYEEMATKDGVKGLVGNFIMDRAKRPGEIKKLMCGFDLVRQVLELPETRGRRARFSSRQGLLEEMEQARGEVERLGKSVSLENIAAHIPDSKGKGVDVKTLRGALNEFEMDFDEWAQGKIK